MKNNFILPASGHFIWLLLCFINLSFSLSAQKFSVSGKVIDGETGEAIPFGNVYPKSNPQAGTTTDFDGYYTLQNVAAGDSIVVSYIGYFKRMKAVNAAEAVNGLITLNFQLLGKVKSWKKLWWWRAKTRLIRLCARSSVIKNKMMYGNWRLTNTKAM
ncbi:MAG: carboxypeptidase-like regulatory domain-containing protein [Microscillaceae bacterium]|nr:carboxypeptidase-like regulatory domain-containing protein [Microscillaceae bacterium]